MQSACLHNGGGVFALLGNSDLVLNVWERGRGKKNSSLFSEENKLARRQARRLSSDMGERERQGELFGTIASGSCGYKMELTKGGGFSCS